MLAPRSMTTKAKVTIVEECRKRWIKNAYLRDDDDEEETEEP